MVFQNEILAGASGSIPTYPLDQSIRFNSADSAYLTRSPSSTGDQKKWTTSFWFKRCKTGATDYLMTAGQTGTNNGVCGIYVNSTDDTIHTYFDTSGSNPAGSVNARKIRDPSAWYHFIWAVDAVNTVQKIWVNGEELSLDAGKNPPNFAYDMNATGSGKRMSFAAQAWGHATFSNIYAAEIHHLDGQYITDPTTFGEYNDDGVWIPIEVSGLTYGTNGFYITGETAADLGEDFSGNNNDFTSYGLTTADQVVDTPTNNFVTLNPLYSSISGSYPTPDLSEGNLAASTSSSANWKFVPTTIYMDSGKWYAEVRVTYSDYADSFIGFASSEFNGQNYTPSETAFGYQFHNTLGIRHNSTQLSAGTFTQGDIIGLALNMDDNEISFYKNGILVYTATSVPAGSWSVGLTLIYTKTLYSNFGQDGTFAGGITAGGNADANGVGDFKYTVPSGFLALCTANLPAPTITDGSTAFQTTLYTGDGSSTQTLTQSENSTFNPDFIWIKNRSNAYAHNINDAVRGYTGASPANAAAVKVLAADVTDFEGLGDTITTAQQRGFVQSSTSNGFIVNKGTSGSQDGFYTNASGHTYAAWQWLAGNGTASNTDGSINTTATSVNTAAGISISTYTGTGSNATFGHGLGAVPKMMIAKKRSSSTHWVVYHQDLTNASYWVALNLTNAQGVEATHWNSTAPTSTVVNLGTNSNTNGSSAPYILYAFAEVEGFSKFGKYTGNGSTNGAFIYTGFKPAFVIFKRIDSADNWAMYDATRDPYNVAGKYLYADSSAAETTYSTAKVDFLSNGFKWRGAVNFGNASAGTYIYMAFAENPFGGDGVAPATAR